MKSEKQLGERSSLGTLCRALEAICQNFEGRKATGGLEQRVKLEWNASGCPVEDRSEVAKLQGNQKAGSGNQAGSQWSLGPKDR